MFSPQRNNKFEELDTLTLIRTLHNEYMYHMVPYSYIQSSCVH
jgi:hypothetical protein